MKRFMRYSMVFALAIVAGCGSEPGANSASSNNGTSTNVAQAQVADTSDAASGPGLLEKNMPAPLIKATDIAGREVDFAKLIAEDPERLIVYFFQPAPADPIAEKLSLLGKRFDDELRIVAVGMSEDEEELRGFASKLGISYYIIGKTQVASEPWLADASSLPMTLIVNADDDRLIVRKVVGSGEARARLIKDIATSFFSQGMTEVAAAAAEVAAESGEDETAVTELKGHIFAAEGKLDEAEAEFGKINSSAGLAKVAYEKGDFDTALQKANEAGNDGYAMMVKGKVLERQGDLDAAQAALDAAVEAPGDDWKASEAANAKGRLLHKQGNLQDAVNMYDQAVQLSPVNFIALSNEGAAQREMGDTEAAEATLAKADRLAKNADDLILLQLRDIAREKERANDQARLEFINQQVKDLGARYKELQESGQAEPVDPWSTRPQVLALLPAESTATFERAGTDIVIRREIEARLSQDPRIRVVEREVLEQLLSELNLGSSEIADKDTQLQLGKVLSARTLGFINFVDAGPDNAMYPRLTNTETTELMNLTPQVIKDAGNVEDIVQATVDQILATVVEDAPLQGLIGDASDPEEVLINLGELHGAKPGMRFMVIEEGEPRVVGGRTIGYKMEKLGEVEITRVDRDFGFAKITEKRDEDEWPTDTKIKQLPAQAEEAEA